MITEKYLQYFFDAQLQAWPECAERYAQLQGAKKKTVMVDGRAYTLSFNPARMRSAAAKVSNGKVDRPCFLCRANRPPLQTDIDIRREGSAFEYLLSVNPYPILPNHFTIISKVHCRQEMTAERLADMEYMASEMEGCLVFFNGACSGASAPDHFHFQAVPQHLVPLTAWSNSTQQLVGVQQCGAENVKINFEQTDFTNILCWKHNGATHWWVVNRSCHRPWQYSAAGDKQVLISPASLEFAGVVPLAREEDYDKMESALLTDILHQCWNREPMVDVGIGKNSSLVERNADGTTTIRNVRIGIGFHWDQQRDFTYEGEIMLRKNPITHEEWIINRLPVERYLESVISSEMSATSSLPLLKAHAVISRSWLLRQMGFKRTLDAADGQVAAVTFCEDDEKIIRWYDSHSHNFFDVCADDHCQRYQGISQKLNPLVKQAIDETRGEVIMSGGEICDARFSKCCGGITEEYKYCWENINPSYLQAVPDTRTDGSCFCNTQNAEVLQQVLNDYDLATHNFYEWEVAYTQAELGELVERKLHLGLGDVLGMKAVERGRSGRISMLEITGSRKTVTIGKELEIRKALSETHLYSSAFDIVTSQDASGQTVFTLKGRGWGHGVGLCQIGAAVMGAEGYDYKEILTHYYKDIDIKKIW